MKKSMMMVISMLLILIFVSGCSSQNAATTAAAPAQTEAAPAGTQETAAPDNEAVPEETNPVIRIGGLSGPTSMGLVRLMANNEIGQTINSYEFAELGTEPAAFAAPLASGEMDIAAIPSNLASVLYNNSNGGVTLLAVNTLGVLNIVERGESINSITDLAGRKVYATGQGAIPEYTLRYVLTANGLNPDSDLEIQWCADTTEALSYISSDSEAVAMLPQPFATVAKSKVEGLRVALDINDVWDELQTGCNIVTGVVVARTAFVQEHPEAVEAFLLEYEASIDYLSEDPETAAELIGEIGIVPAAVAKAAMPACHITFLSGTAMKEAVSGFYEILYEANPASVGGALPGDDFYYGAS